MNYLEKSSYVLTTSGFKVIDNISLNNYVYTSNNTIDRVINNRSVVIEKLTDYSVFQNSVDDISFTVSNKTKVEAINSLSEKVPTTFLKLKVDDWLFHPWIKKNQSHTLNSIDLGEHTSNFYDSNHIYLFNSSILNISKKFNIPQEAVKQLLVREAKEYEEHLPQIVKYIKEQYGIEKDTEEVETSFLELKHYVKDNFVFKMNRFIPIDLNYTAFVVAILTACKVNKTVLKDNTNLYELCFTFDKIKHKSIQSKVLSFVKHLNVKYEEKVENGKTVLNVFNKPLYDYVTEHLLKNILSITLSSEENQRFFTENLFKNSPQVNVNFQVSLQLKELFLYDKQVVGIKQYTQGVLATLLTDDFDKLESTLIVDEKGYYSRVVSLAPFEKLHEKHSSLTVKDNKIIHLGFTECL